MLSRDLLKLTAILVARLVSFELFVKVLGASHISQRRLSPRILSCLVPQCLVGQILDVPAWRILICPSAELITGREYLHFCESYRSASCCFIRKNPIS